MHQPVNIEVNISEYERVLDKLLSLTAENDKLKSQVAGMLREPSEVFKWLIEMQYRLKVVVNMCLATVCNYARRPTKKQYTAMIDMLLDFKKELDDK